MALVFGYPLLKHEKMGVIYEADIEQLFTSSQRTFHKHNSARDLRLRGSCSGSCPALDLKHQHTHPNMDAEAQQAKFAIHQACRDGQSMFRPNISHQIVD